ncbi:hypothetical protein Hanom_Chr13g01190421 [Helianthus anomalus]
MLSEEATQRRKGLVVDTEETLGSSSQPEAGGSSSQVDVEMVDAEADPKGFILVGESSLSFDLNDIARRVHVMQKKKKAKEVLLLKWKDEEKVEEEGTFGLLIVNPNVQQRIEDNLNDEINEQEDDQHQEASTSGKQHLEVPSSRAEMLEELGLDDGKFKFDIEDEIPSSPEREYEFKYAHEADQYNNVIVEDASDSSDEETGFHYSGVDETFPSLAEMFKDKNEDEIRRKIVEKIATEGVPRTIPRENLAKERKKWFKVMPKERKIIRPLQYFTHDKNISWGDILSWGYLEDLQVYAIRREQGV